MACFVGFTSYLFVNGDGGPFHPAEYDFLPARGTRDVENRDSPVLTQFNLTSQIKK